MSFSLNFNPDKNFIKDYKIVESDDGKGGVRKSICYTGNWYAFSAPEEAAKTVRLMLWLLLPAWAGFALALTFPSMASRTAWVLLPFIPEMFPLYKAVRKFFTLRRAGECFEQKIADAADMNGCAYFGLAIGGVSVLLFIILGMMKSKEMMLGDLFFGIGCLLDLSYFLLLRRKAENLRTRGTEKPKDVSPATETTDDAAEKGE